jgi:hypothetical protein
MPAGVLLRVHALVGDPQRLGSVLRLERQVDGAVRAGDREAFTELGERAGRAGHDRPGDLVAGLEQRAEFVAAHAVCVAATVQVVAQVVGQPDQQRISRPGCPKVSL